MLCEPTTRLEVTHFAVRLLPLPASATALQPPMVEPLSANDTLPVGALPVTVAVNVTAVPTVTGLTELERAVCVEPKAPMVLLASFEYALSTLAAL